MPELKKVPSASLGGGTMGSPRRLKEVFMVPGTPGDGVEFVDQTIIKRIHFAPGPLQTGAASHEGNGRNTLGFPVALVR